MPEQPDTATVLAARAGDQAAVDRLIAGYLPLVYTIVGRALEGHTDVDDVVQDTMLRVLRNLADLRDPEAFRSWLVAITVRQVRERVRLRRGAPDALVDADIRDPGADFTDLAITRLELSGQRRETAEATRWLDEDNRELLSLWWLEASGELTRDEIVTALGVTRQHAAVRVQRMKGQLETARVVVRALAAPRPCPDLRLVVGDWDGHPTALWRKRIARHTRDCPHCAPAWSGLVAAERLLVGMALVPLPPAATLGPSIAAAHGGGPAVAWGKGVAGQGGGHPVAVGKGAAGHGGGQSAALGQGAAVKGGGHAAALGKVIAGGVARRVLTAVLAAGAVAGGGAAVALRHSDDRPGTPPAAVAFATGAPQPRPSSPAPSVTSASAPATTGAPARRTTRKAPAAVAAKKGVGVWKFPGLSGALGDVGAGWYYNWAPDNADMRGPAGVEYVPMIWGRAAVTDATLARARRAGRVLLGFNEPDLPAQANLTVEQALELWPRLERTGLRLGSPAVAYGGDAPGGWLDRFMSGAKAQGRRVDFITLHWYGSDFGPAAVGHFLSYVDAVHRRYGLPIWVTEFGLANFGGSPKYPTGAQQAAFIRGSTAGLQARRYVERYAWFGLPAVGDSADFGLYRNGSTPTEAGKAYRAAG
ncbi:RNA polymerase sigma factor (sigma-70 family) [Krasilnikovia cinnamomea]|uniref:RNA polymerase sigma factor n=1 Tax=Krasilnikovia cinnamomea TaxID=349313 RepID=A0A4Q7ZEF3_9ACTN|nr:sigma-70 family RNA polymerase sigma factor [Krasilnikovia cinnamomea]RZU49112.1 RNA polymerase sigma factor (sigma-70 family) [Krasilnikovia cinnamomea]